MHPFLLASMRAAVDSAQQSVDALRAMLTTAGTSPPGAARAGGDPAGGADGDVRAHLDGAALSASTRTVPRWHFPMLNDLERNDAFAVALERVMPRGAHVLDIGSGTGLLAMMAARAGAASVTTCELNPMLAEVATRIIAQNGLSDVITVVPKRSDQLVLGVDLPRRADVLVSEIVDCGLIGEGVLPTVAHAREHLLAPGGTLLPESARLYGALVDSTAVDGLNRVGRAAGFDVGLLNDLATRGHFPVRLPTWPHRLLCDAVQLCAFDFRSGPLDEGSNEVELLAVRSGTAHGLVVWFEMSLGGGVVLRNAPDNLASHWMQAFIPFGRPVRVAEGGRMAIDFSWRDRLSVDDIKLLTMTEGPQ